MPRSGKNSLGFACLGFLFMAIVVAGCAPVVAGVGVAAVGAATTEKGLGTSINDTVIDTKINDALFKENIELAAGVKATVNAGSVLLTGKVKTPEDRVTATNIAWQVNGVKEVITELEVTDKSSLKSVAKDTAAKAKLRLELLGDADVTSLNFSIDVVNGKVFLMGVASSEAEMQAVVGHARQLPFASEVINYIRINTDQR